MKVIAFSLLLTAGWVCAKTESAKTQSNEFNQAMRENIQNVLKNNPEQYETRAPGRFPASASPQASDEDSTINQALEERQRMQELLNQKGVGLPKW